MQYLFSRQDGFSWGSVSPSALSTRDGRMAGLGVLGALPPGVTAGAVKSRYCWCAQTFWQSQAEQKSLSLPAHLSALSRNSREICSFLPSKAPASPGARRHECWPLQSRMASSPPRDTDAPTRSSKKGISPINLWTNVKEAGGGGTFQVPHPKQQIRADMCRRLPAQGGWEQLLHHREEVLLISGLAAQRSLSCQPVLTDHKDGVLRLPSLTIWDVSYEREGAAG